jgi:putative restriction endonuclease
MSEGQESETKNLAYYCNCFSRINVGRNSAGGHALNQPILLVSVIDLIAQGLLKENNITISDELINTFKKYWSVLSLEPYEPIDFAIPIFHLNNKKPKFWHVNFNKQYKGGRPQTINTLRRDIDSVKLDDELFNLLHDSQGRKELIDILMSAWFSSSKKQLEDVLTINQSLQDSSWAELDNIESGPPEREPKFYLRKSLFREAIFRKTVVHLYDYRCAFCQLKVTRSLSQSIVDGAHIKPFAKFFDNSEDNGISLCKNHHWAFDRGWFTLDDRYQIIVASDLQEESPYPRLSMKEFHGELILLPNSEQHYPRLEAIQWHRKNVFTLKSKGSSRK